MLMAHPAVLADLIRQYESLSVRKAEEGSHDAARQLDDVAYTLCISTGTRDIDDALVAARHQLSGARREDDSAL